MQSTELAKLRDLAHASCVTVPNATSVMNLVVKNGSLHIDRCPIGV